MVAGPNRRMQNVLKVSMGLTAAYVLATFLFGLKAHSLALISEAGHNLSDLLAIVLSFVAVAFQARPANDQKTFGYQRAGVLAAFVNAATLVVLSAWIAFTAIQRLNSPVEVQPKLMMEVAAAGVIMNGTVAALLWRFSGDVNIRSVFLHMLGDTLSTAAVIAGGAGILFTHMSWVDPVLSLIIAAMITLELGRHHSRNAQHPARRHTTRHSASRRARGDGLRRRRPRCLHDLHVWSLGAQSHALASHVTVNEMPASECSRILEAINCRLHDSFHITHTTIQFETTGCETTHGCSSPPEAEAVGAHSHHGHAH